MSWSALPSCRVVSPYQVFTRTFTALAVPDGRMWPCKAKALAAHDRAVYLQRAGSHPALNVTPPFLMRSFYTSHVKLLAIVRSPIDRLRHSFYSHPHYRKRSGRGADGMRSYVDEQTRGWVTSRPRSNAAREI